MQEFFTKVIEAVQELGKTLPPRARFFVVVILLLIAAVIVIGVADAADSSIHFSWIAVFAIFAIVIIFVLVVASLEKEKPDQSEPKPIMTEPGTNPILLLTESLETHLGEQEFNDFKLLLLPSSQVFSTNSPADLARRLAHDHALLQNAIEIASRRWPALAISMREVINHE